MTYLYRTDEMRHLEAQAQSGLPAGTLMQRAGEAAGDWIAGWLKANRASARVARVLLLCGAGDNGGDGFVCARHLKGLGHDCVCWAPRPSSRADAQAARARWQEAGGATVESFPDDTNFDIVVDALVGIGARGALDEPYLGALRWAGTHGKPVVAMDVPSGLNADTGEWIGGVAGANALRTFTFLGDKPGLHTLDGIEAAGTVHVASLGLESMGIETAVPGRLNGPAQFDALLRPRHRNSNKGDYGCVAIVGGAPGMVGAGLLAARSALVLGAGKVFVDMLGVPDMLVDPLQPELMFRTEPELPGVDVLVVGCGMGTSDAAHARLERIVTGFSGPAVFDADALNCLARDPGLAARLRARAGESVLTPHPGEAARLLASNIPEVQGDRVGSALALARQYRSIVVLKGAGTILATPSGDYWINTTGGPALATAGTGDALAGMIGALLAQNDDAGEAIRAAVWLHGAGADRFGADVGLTASALAPLAAQALAQLRKST